MNSLFNLVAIGALGGYFLGKLKPKTALIIGVGALMLAGVAPVPTTTTSGLPTDGTAF